MKVTFNDLDEFLAELKADAGKISPKILRVTTRYSRVGSLPLTRIRVVATALAYDYIVTLDWLVGDSLADVSGGVEKKFADQVGKAYAALEDAAKALGLEVRPGVFED